MSCDEGKRLSAQFLQAAIVTRDLVAQVAPDSAEERQARMQDIERAQKYHQDCSREVTEHARLCPACGPHRK